MNKTLYLIALLFFYSSILFSQEIITLPAFEEGYTVREVTKMAVFPGCDSKSDKSVLIKCFSNKLNKILAEYIPDKAHNELEAKGYVHAKSRVQFVVTTKGKIENILILENGNPILDKYVAQAMEKIAYKVDYIEPAFADNDPVNLVFELPVLINFKDSSLNNYEFKEITLLTFISKDAVYEVRQKKIHDGNFYVYQTDKNKNAFIEKLVSIDAVVAKSPYSDMWAKKDGKLLMAEKKVKNILYRIYYGAEGSNTTEVYQVINGEEKLYESFPSENLSASSLYLEIILRK